MLQEAHEKRTLKKKKRKLELSFPLSSAVAQAPWERGNAKRAGGTQEAVIAWIQSPLRMGEACWWEDHFRWC